LHADDRAAESARAVDALAYTVGSDIVFGAGQYAPGTATGRRLLAHELAHAVQQERSSVPHTILRTPANKVGCAASAPLNVPGAPPLSIADPVAVITAAEDLGALWLDRAIADLDATRTRIIGGETIAWPTVGDALALGLRIMNVDPESRAAWTGNGIGSAGLLLRRLRLIRGTLGSGSFFFTCLGPASGTIGSCTGPICSGGAGAVSCGGSFRIVLCSLFWRQNADDQADEILHETAHNFADFIQHGAAGGTRGREGNAYCYTRFAELVGAAPDAVQRTDRCPDP